MGKAAHSPVLCGICSIAKDQLSIGCVLGSLFCFVDLCDYYHDPKHAILITIIFKCHASCYVVLSRFLFVCVWVCVDMCMYICV